MKKLIFIFFVIGLASCATPKKVYRTVIPLVNTGNAPNDHTGESLYSAFNKINIALRELRRIGFSGITADSSEINILHNLDPNLVQIQDVAVMKADILSLPVYADNAAALTGGLTAGQLYRTSTGVLMVVY